jgi:branched-chain amino acid transport system substrate-binding protein
MELLKDWRFESPRGMMTLIGKTRGVLQDIYIRRTERRNGSLQNIETETLAGIHDPNEET